MLGGIYEPELSPAFCLVCYVIHFVGSAHCMWVHIFR